MKTIKGIGILKSNVEEKIIYDYKELNEYFKSFGKDISTNLTFSIVGHTFTEAEIDAINAIDTSSKIRDRVKKINELGGTLCFKTMDDAICYNNFVLIDSCLPHIMANIISL